jgi:type IV pilus assembly protein PilW
MSGRALKGRIGGFTLIEVMVGLVIGLIAILVIGQVTAVFEGQKRTSTGGSDAQTNGMIALATLSNEVTMAGTGLITPALGGEPGKLMCPLGTNIYYGGVVSQPSDSYKGLLAPVRIVDGGAGSDSVTIVRSDAEFGHLAMHVRQFDSVAAPPAVVVDAWPDSAASPTPGQVFIIGKADGSKVCTMFQVTAATNVFAGVPAWRLNFANSGTYPYNPAGTAVFSSFPGYGDGDLVVNMGNSTPYNATTKEGNLSVDRSGFVFRRYDVQCGKMVAVDPSQTAGPYNCTNTSPLIDEIVDLQAQYGIAAAPAGVGLAGGQDVLEWRDAKGTWATTALTAVNIARIKAIRIAVVARSPQYEKPSDYVSPASIPLWTATGVADPAPVFTVPDTHYRYKVFTTIVPIKYVIWGNL